MGSSSWIATEFGVVHFHQHGRHLGRVDEEPPVEEQRLVD